MQSFDTQDIISFEPLNRLLDIFPGSILSEDRSNHHFKSTLSRPPMPRTINLVKGSIDVHEKALHEILPAFIAIFWENGMVE
jgi:hypothetical protein